MKIKKRITGFIITLLLFAAGGPLSLVNGFGFSLQSSAAEQAGSDDRIFLPVGEVSLPEYYNLREHGRAPAVKSQGSYGTCWALAATSALESSLLPEERIVLSADHLTFRNAFEVPVEDGGDYLMTMAYLAGWQGPAAEDEDPYGDGKSPEGLTPVLHVQEIQLLKGASEQEIKRSIFENGAVQTSLFLDRNTVSERSDMYQEWSAAYYDADTHVQNHDIILIGWDDRFSRFLFRNVPESDGAWICQNSWGEEFGNEGIFYVSYADANICRTALSYTGIESVDNYDTIMQTDPCGWQGSQGYGDDTCWFSNVYYSDKKQQLEAAGFYATGDNTSYEIYLVSAKGIISENAGFSETFQANERVLMTAGKLKHAGYYTIKLPEPVLLDDGETFALIVKICTPGSENPAAVEYRADEYTKNVVTEGKYGYLSHDGENWTHTEAVYGTNICLKSYLSDIEKG